MHQSGFSVLPPLQWSNAKAKAVAAVFEGVATPILDAIEDTYQVHARNVAVTVGRAEIEALRDAAEAAGVLPASRDSARDE
jgi:hypothetical protein